jgi:hypothetical protein
MMRTTMLAATLLALSGSAWAWGDGCEVQADRALDVEADGIETLELLARAGDLVIEGRADVRRIELRGKACASSDELLARIQLAQRGDGARRTVEVLMPELSSGWGNEQAWLDLRVLVPARLALQLKDSSGDTEVRGIASLDVSDSSGDLTLRDIAGDLALQDSSGDVQAHGIGGSVEVRIDSSGDLEIEQVQGAVRILRDSSGSIALRDVRGDATVEVDSSGEIEFDRIGGSALVGTDSSGSIRAHDIARDFTVRRDGSGEIAHSGVQGTLSIPSD